MRIFLIVAVLAMLVSVPGKGGAMEKVRSKDYVIEPASYDGKSLSVRLPSGTVSIVKNGPLKIDYFLEYNGDDSDAAKIFESCKIQFDGGLLSAEYPVLRKGWLNAHYRVTVPADVAVTVHVGAGNVDMGEIHLRGLAVFLGSGNTTLNSTVVQGGLSLTVPTGGARVLNAAVHGRSDISVENGEVTLKRPVFGNGGNVKVNKGRISWQYDPKNTGKVKYVGALGNKSRIDFVTTEGCSAEGNELTCSPALATTTVSVKKGRLVLKPK